MTMPWIYFIDPVLRGPTLGCMLMCLSAALMGVFALLRKQSLIGEALSHATYPGVILGILLLGLFSIQEDEFLITTIILLTAFFSALLGIYAIHFLEVKAKVKSDTALCFILSAFFGVGLTLASHIQFSHSKLYALTLSYLYGQAATMTDIHIYLFGFLALLIILFVALTYKEMQMITLDRNYAISQGIPVRWMDTLYFILIVLSIVIGIRSVGVVLMSAMLIAPAIAARQLTHHLGTLFFLSGCLGVLSAFLGNYLSVELSQTLHGCILCFPTGPSIVIVAAFFCVLSLMFAPERGYLMRLLRIAFFRYECAEENMLKAMWRHGPMQQLKFSTITEHERGWKILLYFILGTLIRGKWIEKHPKGSYSLTEAGFQRASHIVRLHRLWEVYLADYVGMGVERVHRSAEEMEHILTPELEQTLTLLLKDPKVDPHHQPIPPSPNTL